MPRSAAGIFQSNLSDDGSKDDLQQAVHYDIERMSEIIGAPVHEPSELYARQRDDSLVVVAQQLNLTLEELTLGSSVTTGTVKN